LRLGRGGAGKGGVWSLQSMLFRPAPYATLGQQKGRQTPIQLRPRGASLIPLPPGSDRIVSFGLPTLVITATPCDLDRQLNQVTSGGGVAECHPLPLRLAYRTTVRRGPLPHFLPRSVRGRPWSQDSGALNLSTDVPASS
jgi:hypothetical protein